MRQSLLHTEHVAPSRAASHSLLGMLAVQAGVHGQRAPLPAPHAQRLLATGAAGLDARACLPPGLAPRTCLPPGLVARPLRD